MNTERSRAILRRASQVIPEQTFTFAKAAHNYPPGFPAYVQSAAGCELLDVDGNRLLDFTMALGPIVLGYAYPRVNQAVARQLEHGTTYSLPHPIEVDLAEELVRVVPCAERVRLYKNGADATGMAIRIARSWTKRRHVLQAGYHGHHEWSASTLRSGGVLREAAAYTHPFTFNDLASVRKFADEFRDDVAAVILEVAFEVPQPGFLEGLRELCDERGIVLVFDEMWTGFRFKLGGFQEYWGVTPDLATFSKAMANGFPIAALTGKAAIMDEFANVWGFTTFAGETLSIRAALETIGEMQEQPVHHHLWRIGGLLRAGLEKAVAQRGLEGHLRFDGFDCRFKLVAAKNPAEVKAHVQRRFLEDGILWNNQFVSSYAHRDEHVERTVESFRGALRDIA